MKIPSLEVCFYYSCSHTVRKYLRQTAKCVVLFISLQISVHVLISSFFPFSWSVVVIAITFRVVLPIVKSGIGFTGELLSVNTLRLLFRLVPFRRPASHGLFLPSGNIHGEMCPSWQRK